jgi:hypothetical protein
MTQAVFRDMKKSGDAFDKYLHKPLCKILGADEILPIEDMPGRVSKIMDAQFGWDRVAVCKGRLITIASRIQFGPQDYSTTTIRYERIGRGLSSRNTEFKKRMDAINNGGTFPEKTVQAYVDQQQESLLSFLVVDTRDLYLFTERIIDGLTCPICGGFVYHADEKRDFWQCQKCNETLLEAKVSGGVDEREVVFLIIEWSLMERVRLNVVHWSASISGKQ